MKRNGIPQRQLQQCGLLPRVERVGGMPVVGWPVPGSDYRTETCPTYTTQLPEVREVAGAFPQWKERTLTEWLEEAPTPEFLLGLALLGNAINAHDSFKAEQRAEEMRRKP